jgi:hypothetical protein
MNGESTSVVGVVGEILSLTSGSGEELAAQVGVSYASLYAWSRGRRHPTQRNARSLAEVARRRARRLTELADALMGLELDKVQEAQPLGPTVPASEMPAPEVASPEVSVELTAAAVPPRKPD